VYYAFDVFHASDGGPLAPVPIREEDELRASLYRFGRSDQDTWPADYEKILVERVLLTQIVSNCPGGHDGDGNKARRRDTAVCSSLSSLRTPDRTSVSISYGPFVPRK
jgi:hypothetical protein